MRRVALCLLALPLCLLKVAQKCQCLQLPMPRPRQAHWKSRFKQSREYGKLLEGRKTEEQSILRRRGESGDLLCLEKDYTDQSEYMRMCRATSHYGELLRQRRCRQDFSPKQRRSARGQWTLIARTTAGTAGFPSSRLLIVSG